MDEWMDEAAAPRAGAARMPSLLVAAAATASGDLGERFKPAVLKTADGQPSVSSNLTVSAKISVGLDDLHAKSSNPA